MDIEEEEGRRALGEALVDHPRDVAGDQRDGDQQGDAHAERHHHVRGRRAGPVQVREREAQPGAARTRHGAGEARQAARRGAQYDQREARAEDEPDGESTVVDADDREPRERQREAGNERRHAGRRPGPLGRDEVAEQAGGGTSPARASGQTAKTSVASSPNSAARPSDAGWTASASSIGRNAPISRPARIGASTPNTSPSAMPAAARPSTSAR